VLLEVVANELVSSRYRIKQFDMTTDESGLLLELDASEKRLQALERTELRFSVFDPLVALI
jgi:hypothetical protein